MNVRLSFSHSLPYHSKFLFSIQMYRFCVIDVCFVCSKELNEKGTYRLYNPVRNANTNRKQRGFNYMVNRAKKEQKKDENFNYFLIKNRKRQIANKNQRLKL